jgi:SAM-dependent methyltransferase
VKQDGRVTWEWLTTTYDTVARKYEARFLDELAGKPRDRELLSAFSESARDPVIEIGCGPGQIGAFARERGRRVVGVDLSREMARLAGTRLDAALVGDMRALPFASGLVGGIVAFYSLIHLQRPELGPTLAEFHRVLRDGGRLLFSVHEGEGDVVLDRFVDEPVPFAATLYSLDEMVAATDAAGFDVTTAERRRPYADESTVRLYVEAAKPA